MIDRRLLTALQRPCNRRPIRWQYGRRRCVAFPQPDGYWRIVTEIAVAPDRLAQRLAARAVRVSAAPENIMRALAQRSGE